MATTGVFDIELNEGDADLSDNSDEEPIQRIDDESVQVRIKSPDGKY
jgi:hypothetical protein